MTEALIFYRTDTAPDSKKSTIPDPHNLAAGQRLNFVLPDNVFQAIEEYYRNNNKKFPIPTAKGNIKKIGVSPAGMKGYNRKVRGYFKGSASASITKIRAFRKVQQVDDFHEFGRFGMVFGPEAADFDVDGDPDDTFGWTFDEYTLKNLSIFSNKVFDFSIDLGFGGTLP